MALSPRTRFRILERDGFRCRYCGRTAEYGTTLQVDHVIPVSRGGSDEPANLVAACATCNLGKSDIHIAERPPPVVIDIAEYTCEEWFADEAEARQYGCDSAGECGRRATRVAVIPGYDGITVCERHAGFYAREILYRLDSVPLPPAA